MYRFASRLRAQHRNRPLGQSIVEFALILPIFLLFFAAALDLGRVFYANITLNNAAREGAFQASLTPQLYVDNQACNQATNRVVCRIQNETTGSMIAITPADIDMTCSVAGCAKAAGSLVTVEVRGKFRLVTPLLSAVFGGQELDLTSSAVAQIEYLPNPNTATPPPGPVANFTGCPTTIAVGGSVTFNSSSSTGPPSGYMWDFDGDGVADSTAPNPTRVYNSAGTFTVTLTVNNLTGVDSEVRNNCVIVTSSATPPPGPTPTPTVAPTPTCVYPPNVMGQHQNVAAINLQNAGFNNVTILGDLTNGQKNKIQAQNPDHTQCVALNTQFVLHYRPS